MARTTWCTTWLAPRNTCAPLGLNGNYDIHSTTVITPLNPSHTMLLQGLPKAIQMYTCFRTKFLARTLALIRGAIIEAMPNQLYSCVQPLQVPKCVKRVDCMYSDHDERWRRTDIRRLHPPSRKCNSWLSCLQGDMDSTTGRNSCG